MFRSYGRMTLVAVMLTGLGWAAPYEDPHARKISEKKLSLRTPEAVAAGEKLFTSACSGCHGRRGEGGRGPKLNEGDMIRGASDERLFTSIKNGVKGTSMPPFDLPDLQIRQLLGFIRGFSAPASDVVLPGDARAGETIYFGKGDCASCHTVRGRGGYRGPDLSTAGGTRTAMQLRKALVKPELLVSGEYRGVRATLRSGQTIEGVIRNASNYAVEIQTADGAIRPVAAEDVKAIEYRKGPLMPEYASRLSAKEIDDVIAFLATQTGRSRGATE